MQEIVVPVDDSETSWTAAAVGCSLATSLDAHLTLLAVVDGSADPDAATALLEQGARALDTNDLPVSTVVRFARDSVAGRIEEYVEASTGAVLVMGTHGRGRSSAMVGSVADDVLGRTFGPIVLVGPNVEKADLGGPVVIAVDGSKRSEHAVPLGVAWAIELGATPWVVHCRTDDGALPADLDESSYVAGLARTYGERSGHPVEFEELHGEHAETEVARFAERFGASMIVATTHGRTGLRRLTMGSVVSGFVRHATCPILVEKPPHADD